MKIIKYILGLILVTSLTSCNDWFDVSPKSDVKAEDLFQQESGFRDALTGVYALMSTTGSYGRQLTFGYLDVLAQYYNSSTSNNHEYIYTRDYLYTEPEDKDALETIWSNQYKCIANLNAMLMFIDEKRNVFSSDAIYRIYKGEALALRGMLHFDMLRLFAPSPVMGKDRKAIPYMETYTNIPQQQQTVEGTLNKVITDLEAARDLMRDVDSYGPNYEKLYNEYENNPQLANRVKHLNYYAITALLARVQLYAGNKDAALAAAKEIIGEPEDEPVEPFTLAQTISSSDRLFSSEILFALEEQKMEDNIDLYFGETAADVTFSQSSTALGMSISQRDKLFTQQNPADDDYRLKYWFQETNSSTAVMPAKYNSALEIPMIHLSELYYIAAECSTDKGLDYLNRLRAHRGLVAISSTSDLQNEIYKEYCKEFLCEGQMFYYYKRLGMNKIGVFRSVSIDPEAVYVIPFPDDELDFGLIE